MKCEACRKDAASIHYFENVNGSSRTLGLCAGCAAGHGVELLATLKAETLMGARPGPGGMIVRGRRCPGCRQDESQFLVSQAYKCPACRDSFLTPSQPQFAADFERARGRAGLLWRLNEAVGREDFELAAVLRDELAALDRPQTPV